MLAAVSLLLGAVVLLGAIQLWTVFAVALGALTALDNPARMTFIPEMVGSGLLRNAITSTVRSSTSGRAVRPVVAATLVASVGVGWCFVANGVSFVGVLAALLTLNVAALCADAPVGHHAHQLRDGLSYARHVPQLLAPLCMMALIGTFTYEFEVTLPLFARGPLAGGDTTYSWLMGGFGFGAVLGGIYCTRHAQTGVPRMIRAAGLYMAAMLATACTDSVTAAVLLLILVGFASIIFLTTGNSTVQIASAPADRGRVTALWSIAFVGSTPIGATIIGAIGAASPRLALVTGAAACGAAALTGTAILAHSRLPQLLSRRGASAAQR
jgi:MFS family permease